jgi:hypothetical protein
MNRFPERVGREAVVKSRVIVWPKERLFAGALFALRVFFLLTTFCLSAPQEAAYAEPAAPRGEVPLFVDFLQYRAAATAVLSGQNPYDPSIIAALEYKEFPNLSEPVLQWNPPFLFPFTLPFTGGSFETTSLLWLGLLSVLLAVSIQMTRGLLGYGPRTASQKIFFVLGIFLFFPIWECFRFGQVSPLLLAGFAGFLVLRFGNRRSTQRDFLAGLCLSLTLIKPHLLYLVYLSLVIESLRQKRYQELLGLFTGALCLGVLPLFWRASLWAEYFAALQTMPLYFRTPTLGSLLQSYAPGAHWLRFLPSVLTGVIAAPLLYSGAKDAGNKDKYLFIAALSLFTAPYGWVYDQVLLLPLVIGLLVAGKTQRILTTGYVSLGVLGFPWFGKTELHEYWWYSMGLLVLAALIFLQNRLISAQSKPA